MFVSAIVVAAGSGRRLKSRVSKPVLKLNLKPVIAYSLGVLNSHPDIKEIIVVGNPGNISVLGEIVKKYGFKKAGKIILGGKERQDSVACGLKSVDNRAGFVLIHDAVRPFITKGLVTALINSAGRFKASIAAVPVKATIKSAGRTGCVEKTIARNNLWEVQTPQVFSRQIITKAYERFGSLPATDDAMLVEKLGAKVKIVLGSYKNIKITTPEDLVAAKGLLKK